MSLEDCIRDIIVAIDDIEDELPGGVYTWTETRSNGINKSDTPNAFSPDIPDPDGGGGGSQGHLLNTALVKKRSETAGAFGLMGNERTTGLLLVVEIYIYAERNWDDIEVAKAQIASALQREHACDYGRLRYDNILQEQDEAMGDVPFFRLDFSIPGLFNPPDPDDD